MPSAPSRVTAVVLAAVFVAATLLPRLAGWAEPDRALEITAAVLAAMLASCLRTEGRAASDRSVMPAGFVITFAALMLLGPYVAGCVAGAATLPPGCAAPPMPRARGIVAGPVAVVGTQAAGVPGQLPGYHS